MTGKNEQALAMAFRRALAMSAKIKELEITPDMDEEAVDAMVKFLAETKAEKEGIDDWKQFLKGQRWYVEDLKHFSGLDSQQRLDKCYREAFPDVASEQEMLNMLDAIQ